MNQELIAPCGMNCGICIGFFGYTMTGAKRKKQCIGCKPSGKSCAHLKKYCEKLRNKEIDYCYVLCKDWEGEWKPSKWIPIAVAKYLGKIVS